MNRNLTFSSESVGEGHPDKVADYISDSILDACLEGDPESRVACETLVKSNMVVLAGEITTRAKLDFDAIVRNAIREIGYVFPDEPFNADTVFITNLLTPQSPDIAQGVDAAAAEGKATIEQGAGDQGIMFGYACDQTPERMPAPVIFSHRLLREIARRRKAGDPAWLRPDVKSQVALDFDGDGQPTAIKNVVISTQHAADVTLAEVRRFCVEEVIRKVLPAEMLCADEDILINPTGRFSIGGPQGDAGLTGRKIIVDTYGGWARHGGGAFSGKDPSKVDRSAAYFTRWVAKAVVDAGLARECELQVAYAIGYPHPTSVLVRTFGTSRFSDEVIAGWVRECFDFRPAEIIRRLDLKRPIYRATTHYGHFGKEGLPWEDTTQASADLRSVAGLA